MQNELKAETFFRLDKNNIPFIVITVPLDEMNPSERDIFQKFVELLNQAESKLSINLADSEELAVSRVELAKLGFINNESMDKIPPELKRMRRNIILSTKIQTDTQVEEAINE